MHNKHFVKEPLGWRIRRPIKGVFKKMNLKYTNRKRIEILKKKGLILGKNVIIDKQAYIDNNYCHLIRLFVQMLKYLLMIQQFISSLEAMGEQQK